MHPQPLKNYRKRKGQTMQELASEMQINSSTLHRIEHNVGNQTVRRVLDWCRTNNFDPYDIFPPDASA